MNRKVDILILDESHLVLKFLLNRKVNIYGIKDSSLGRIYTVRESDIERIPFEIKIVGYKGFKLLYHSIIKNKYFIIGLFLAVIEMFILSNMIIKIDVLHNDREIRELLYEELEKNGIHEFMFKKSFDSLQIIKDKIKENNKDKIEWLEIVNTGMKYTIRVEKREKIKAKKENKYCDIISLKDAIITNSLISKGQIQADINDYVKKGTTIVSGEIKYNDEVKGYICSQGSILGNTWYTLNIKIPYTYTLKTYTGKKRSNYMVLFNNHGKPLFKSHFNEYDVIKKEILSVGPISIYRLIEREYYTSKRKYTKDELIEVALAKGRAKIKEQIGSNGSILYEKVLQTEEYDSIIIMDIFYSTKESIGLQIEKDIPDERVKTSGIT